ncbi:hypothetical protein [Williamsia muralis]|uniref:Uncharacterized protein n=1 Tax=Williamsia marianensis TaxID=85044 RepID=A0ABU4F0Z3_WILMA|nr:hypothetical protein [Williamsia muralis]MDV7137170.1 hypothetical protein [Williamsia muralis]
MPRAVAVLVARPGNDDLFAGMQRVLGGPRLGDQQFVGFTVEGDGGVLVAVADRGGVDGGVDAGDVAAKVVGDLAGGVGSGKVGDSYQADH